jgi:serine/threonine protein kinase
MSRPAGRIVDAPLLLSRYRPLQLLARGGSSSVYQGRDEVLGRDVAIKLFNSGSGPEVNNQSEELRVLASLSHHGIVAVIDAGIDDSAPSDPRPFLVMELVHGLTLRETLKAREPSAREIGEVGYEIAEVLEYIHSRGVVHRDITPSNIMLVDYGTAYSRPRARLTDFGIAIDALSIKNDGDGITGTVAYLSPEQVAEHRVLPASDIYSLGLVLIEGFTRSIAFPGTRVVSAIARLSRRPEVPESVPAALRPVLEDMTRIEASDRPSAGGVLESLRVALREVR